MLEMWSTLPRQVWLVKNAAKPRNRHTTRRHVAIGLREGLGGRLAGLTIPQKKETAAVTGFAPLSFHRDRHSRLTPARCRRAPDRHGHWNRRPGADRRWHDG